MDVTRAIQLYGTKCRLLHQAFSQAAGDIPAHPAADAGYAVAVSVCDGSSRARVIWKTGRTIEDAWNAARHGGQGELNSLSAACRWVKVDIVTCCESVHRQELPKLLSGYHEFFREGISLDSGFHYAFLEAELNGAKLWDYEAKDLDLPSINRYRKTQGLPAIARIPDSFFRFSCMGWICDDNNDVFRLSDHGLTYGRRLVPVIDRPFTLDLLTNAASWLMRQLNSDGSFVYGIYPRFDRVIPNYNYVRHASTIWSLICDYRITQNASLIPKIDLALQYLKDHAIVYRDDNTAFLMETKSQEIKLGGLGIAVIAMTEYMDALGNEKWRELAEKLGNGILSMQDGKTGIFRHVLNPDYSVKEAFRTVYYDGEAAFALARLYGLTHDPQWLEAAKKACDHFISANYARYRDHWIAYCFNEITKYCPDQRYYTFALQNAQQNLNFLYNRETTYHTFLELLMVTFETYDRIITDGVDVPYLKFFDTSFFLRTIYCRIDRMLNGYFFPEYAMYMKRPDHILHTFMVRHDGYRVRIDDVQHNIGGIYLYYKNYDKLVQYGMLEATRLGYGQEK